MSQLLAAMGRSGALRAVGDAYLQSASVGLGSFVVDGAGQGEGAAAGDEGGASAARGRPRSRERDDA